MAMRIVCEVAATGRADKLTNESGGRGFDELLTAAAGAAPALGGIGFCEALDTDFGLPGRSGADRVVVLGIGGSALGSRAVDEVCRVGRDTLPIVVVDNIDPQSIEEAWAGGDPRRTAWVAISKSGGTTETLAQFGIVRERLRELGGGGEIHVVTGPEGNLRDLASREGYPAYDVPVEVGGRFSVFTPAATVPLALAGHDVAALIEGARDARADAQRPDGLAVRLAAFLIAGAEAGRNVVTLWSYAERLETVGEWFRQLWAESLGKIRADGTAVGQTPVHCVGSTDQHSIQQLMVEGPPDKVVLVLSGPIDDATVAPAGEPGAGSGHSLGAILDAMRRATSAEMVRAGCPLVTLKLDRYDERDMGALLMQFLCATVLGGRLLDVDPFGQPGVEAAKIATKKLLSEPGGDEDRAIADLLGEKM